MTRGKKKFLSEYLGADVKVGDGPASKELIDKTTLVVVNKKLSGISFDGVKVVVTHDRGKTFGYSIDKKYRDKVNEYKTLIDNAKIEHIPTLEGSIDEEVRSGGVTPNEFVSEDIALNLSDRIDALSKDMESELVDGMNEFIEAHPRGVESLYRMSGNYLVY